MVRIISSGRALHSSEYHEKKRKERRFRLWFYFFIVVVVVVIPIILLRLDKFRVSAVEVTGLRVVAPADVQSIVQIILNEKYLWLIPKDNDLLIPKGAIKQTLFDKLSRIKDVDMNLLDAKTLNVHIEERSPLALYCQNAEEFLEARNCYFLDEDGFIFAKAPEFSGEVYFVYSRKPMMVEPIGQQFLTKEKFRNISAFVNDVSKIGFEFKVMELYMGVETPVPLLRFFTEGGAPVYWHEDESLELIYSTLYTLVSSGVLEDRVEPLDNIIYLDLTLPNKPYWKNK